MKDTILNKKFKYTYWNSTSWIAAACVIVYMMTQVANFRIKGVPLLYWLSLIPSFTKFGCVWQFITYMFVHGSPLHLLFNLYALMIFGNILERSLGSREFLFFYFLTGILGGVFCFVIYQLTGMVNVAIMGASGAIYAMLFLESVLAPQSRVVLFFIIPLKMPVAMLIFIGLEILSQLTGGGDGIAHLVHLSSIAIAWIYCVLRMKISPLKVWKDNL